MRQILPHLLWLGHAGDARDLRAVLAADIAALVDLDDSSLPVKVTRDLVYCRFPVLDGAGNPAWLLRAAVDTVAGLLRARTPTLVFCGAGMSRSPAIAAAALALVGGQSPEECLAQLAQSGPSDVMPALWHDIKDAMGR
jgi:protein-tyrosine phosphatase